MLHKNSVQFPINSFWNFCTESAKNLELGLLTSFDFIITLNCPSYWNFRTFAREVSEHASTPRNATVDCWKDPVNREILVKFSIISLVFHIKLVEYCKDMLMAPLVIGWSQVSPVKSDVVRELAWHARERGMAVMHSWQGVATSYYSYWYLQIKETEIYSILISKRKHYRIML